MVKGAMDMMMLSHCCCCMTLLVRVCRQNLYLILALKIESLHRVLMVIAMDTRIRLNVLVSAMNTIPSLDNINSILVTKSG